MGGEALPPIVLLLSERVPALEEELLSSAEWKGSMCVPLAFGTLSFALWLDCSFLPGLAGHQPLPPEAGLHANYVNHGASAGD